MMFKYSVLASAVLGSVAAQDNKIPCNSAAHCSPISNNCMPCPPFKLENGKYVEDPSCTVDSGPGACASTVALTANPNSPNEVRYGVPYTERCRRIVDAAINERSSTPEHSYYVKNCREGMFTCNDGYCEFPANYPSDCYGGIVDSGLPEDANHPCNIFYPAGLAKVSAVWDAITGNKPTPEEKYQYMHDNYCLNHGGVRYHPFRCNRAALGDGIATTDCEGGIERGFVCDEDNSVQNTVSGPGDACYAECDEDGEEESLPGCCIVPGSDVCSSITVKTDTNPPPEDDHGNEANGIEIGFKFKPSDMLEENTDCCCDFVCTCFGDPHCSSFFGDYQVSQDNTGGYSLIADQTEEFIVDVTLARPGGVNKDFYITIGADQYIISAESCVKDLPQTKNGVQNLDVDSEPKFYYSHTAPTNSNADLATNPAKLVIKQGPYTLSLTCIHFEMTLGPDKGWYDRIDASLKVSDVVVAEGTPDKCCPSMESAFNELSARVPKVRGYCVRQRGSEEDGLPNPRDPSTLGLPGRRLLEDMSRAVMESPGKNPKRHLANEHEGCSDELIEEYAYFMKMTLAQAHINCMENGADSLKNAVALFNENCKYVATEDVFQLDAKGPCDQGLYVQRSINGGEFENILFLPSTVTYCHNKIFIPFNHVSPPLEKDHEIRLSLCQPDALNPQCEGLLDKCQPTVGVDGISVIKYTYGTGLEKAYESLLAHAEQECSCAGTGPEIADCYRQCIAHGKCPAVGTCDA